MPNLSATHTARSQRSLQAESHTLASGFSCELQRGDNAGAKTYLVVVTCAQIYHDVLQVAQRKSFHGLLSGHLVGGRSFHFADAFCAAHAALGALIP